MVELGKRDFIGHGHLAMDVFEENRSFFGVHMVPICEKRPKKIRKILERTMDLSQYGSIRPIQPMTVFDAVQIEDAFRFMQKGQHIEKLVVRLPENLSVLGKTAAPVHQKLSLRSDVSYLLIGGLGGLGRSISTWMAERGARNLVYL